MELYSNLKLLIRSILLFTANSLLNDEAEEMDSQEDYFSLPDNIINNFKELYKDQLSDEKVMTISEFRDVIRYKLCYNPYKFGNIIEEANIIDDKVTESQFLIMIQKITQQIDDTLYDNMSKLAIPDNSKMITTQGLKLAMELTNISNVRDYDKVGELLAKGNIIDDSVVNYEEFMIYVIMNYDTPESCLENNYYGPLYPIKCKHFS
ncbi:uncharacterized protein LOC126893872 isoform X3 [Daktulosphaira vitifoliae]|uniref:uncharacterized protein LOC126893872 isoform X3 n=1 Tax=Daktulosphaira vitifoliae TaxID=58002 RepID=UPI0021AA1823|nr:uncharacterized protein LOC126893872 isoform X3 [Daktulosphaira vitifoliae]